MSATSWRCVCQIRYRSGSTVRMPSGPGGSASDPATSAARFAAAAGEPLGGRVGVLDLARARCRNVADDTLDDAAHLADGLGNRLSLHGLLSSHARKWRVRSHIRHDRAPRGAEANLPAGPGRCAG